MIFSWLGLIIGVGGVLLGQVLEGGHLTQLVVPTAAMIVFGGTMGATFLSCTKKEVFGAIGGLKKILLGGEHNLKPLMAEIIQIAGIARREGILALERVMKDIKDPFFAVNLKHIIDGYDANAVKEMLEEHILTEEEEGNAIAKVFETAGGFAPTIGIIGAVLGLIHVMSNLSDSSKLGSGIAVAFVATVYGVGSANLILIPMGNKMKKIVKAEVLELKMIYFGLLGIQAGLNPRVIEDQLKNLVGDFSEESIVDTQKKAA